MKRRDLMNEIKEYTEKVFENIKHIDKNGNEYWLAREYKKFWNTHNGEGYQQGNNCLYGTWNS
jgi:hypothetical protein